MITGKCKGARDFMPDDVARLNYLEDKFRKACLNRGFEEIRTPVIEYFHLFTSAGTLTPKMLGRVYSFLDWDGWSGERVVLRPEGTIPAARLYLENFSKNSIARLFYIENMFSFEEKGSQPREKWQGGVEIIGSSEISADAELITLALEILESLDIGPVELKLSHAGYLRAVLSSLGLPAEREEKLYEAIVDGQDIQESIISASRDMEDKAKFENLTLLREKTLRSLQNLKALTRLPDEMQKRIENFTEICSLIESLGYKCHMDFVGGRGLEYYTGIYYRLYVNNVELGGGGRYDSLVNKGNGTSVPASGFAIYLDKILSLIPEVSPVNINNFVQVSIANRNASSILAALKAAKYLRQKGYPTKLSPVTGRNEKSRWFLKFSKSRNCYHLKDRDSSDEWQLNSLEEVSRKMGELR